MTNKHRAKRILAECPYCHKQFGNVKNHVLMAHGSQIKPETLELTKEDLLTGKPPASKIDLPDQEYHCSNCQAKLKKGENPCWQCHQRLIWEGIT